MTMAEGKKQGIQPAVIARMAGKALFILVFIALHCRIAGNFIRLSKDMVRGDFSASSLAPAPRYGFLRVPSGALALRVNAVHRLAADFAQIYFPAKDHASLSQAYTKESPDPWRRPSRYAPLLHALCAVSLCRFDYGLASVLHMAIQLLLFHLSFAYAFRALHLEKLLLPGILLVNCCLFLTPVGLSWMERGQFSLYVALAYLWLLLGMINGKVAYMFVAALFAYVKWTSFPFILVVFAVWVLNSRNGKELKGSMRFAAVFLISMALFFLPFWEAGMRFVAGLMNQELSFAPQGLSLVLLLPKLLVKALPFVLIAVGYLHLWKHRHDLALLAPFFIGSGIILVTYPTLAYDYSVPTLFCFIPFVLYWSRLPAVRHGLLGHAITWLFIAFLILASCSSYVIQHFQRESVMIQFYLVSASLFLLLPLLFPFPCPAQASATQNQKDKDLCLRSRRTT